MSDPFFYRLMILGKPVCGCLEFENPILKIEFRTQVTYVFPACHDMEGVWSEEFLSATCSLNNIVPYDIIVEKIYVTNGDFKFEQVNYQPDWRMLVERYTYRDEGSGVHLNKTLLDDIG